MRSVAPEKLKRLPGTMSRGNRAHGDPGSSSKVINDRREILSGVEGNVEGENRIKQEEGRQGERPVIVMPLPRTRHYRADKGLSGKKQKRGGKHTRMA